MDRSAESSLPGIPTIRRGSSDNTLDLDSDGGGDRSSSGCEVQRSRSCLDNLQQKILKVTEQLKIEQTARDENVAEYLKLVNSADKQQMSRIKQVFEKKNQKSSQNIAQMQKKLEQYHKKMKDTEVQQPSHGLMFKHSTIPRESSRELLKDITGSGRHPTMDKIKTIGPGVSLSPPFFFSKPREFANLIRNKFGSADNIDHLKSPEIPLLLFPHDSASKGLSSKQSMGRQVQVSQRRRVLFGKRFHFGQYEQLEDQLNDLTELHQNEMANLKQELTSIEERVAYQAQERARDIQEALESCQTRVSKLELQQQHQQTVQLETHDARILLGKTINIMLAIITVVLVCVSTAAKFAAP
ncbi:hypothetical protein WMY93_023275 [Mugilogobius chulae]|uniref:Transmembrane and coiled-coil domain family 3 n=1 Tax=Mugilogobius chulae TaxID=88201 RepID=A0AAW0N8A5_9GOBI